jgi:hypothetical protein
VTAPRRSAVTLVDLAVLVLPRGTVRERYRAEFLAELHDLAGRALFTHAIGVLAHAWSLRHSVLDSVERAPWHCRWHLYHHYRTASTDDGRRFRRCADCGRDDPHVGLGPRDDVAWVGVMNAR